MATQELERSFQSMGARVKVAPREVNRWRRANVNDSGFSVDVRQDKIGEYFDLRFDEKINPRFTVLNVDPSGRHLLLLAATPRLNAKGQKIGEIKGRILLGHDERHWFAAGVPAPVSTVKAAKEALKPVEIRELEQSIPARDRHRRRNAVRIRQGEWFFIPAPNFILGPTDEILKKELLTRGRGSKPHVCEEVCRFGGETVWVGAGEPSIADPAGVANRILTESQFRRLPLDEQKGFSTMKRNATVYARGAVRHADHETIYLDGWHKVLMNAESNLLGAVEFLD